MSWNTAIAGVPTLILVAVLWRGGRRVPAGQFAWWQERFQVQVAPEDEAYVLARLRQARVVRAVFAAAGIAVAGLPFYLNVLEPTSASDFSGPAWGNAWVVGGVVGAVLAEVLVLQRPARRAASLVPRRAGDYVDLRWARWIGAGVVLTVLATAVAASGRGFRWWHAPLGLAASGLSAAALALGLRSIVRRPALDAGGHLRAVDEALRADGAHHLVGACVALSGTALDLAARGLGFRGWYGLLGLAASLVSMWSLLLWMTLARETRWSVPHARAAAAVGTR